mmetsp:Transcript_38605/g.78870  ORF Transcript_38605/g.78870 Transcript_38605/m.78870 type:complete len:108 (+) Transcript_38605:74-397(+)
MLSARILAARCCRQALREPSSATGTMARWLSDGNITVSEGMTCRIRILSIDRWNGYSRPQHFTLPSLERHELFLSPGTDGRVTAMLDTDIIVLDGCLFFSPPDIFFM